MQYISRVTGVHGLQIFLPHQKPTWVRPDAADEAISKVMCIVKSFHASFNLRALKRLHGDELLLLVKLVNNCI